MKNAIITVIAAALLTGCMPIAGPHYALKPLVVPIVAPAPDDFRMNAGVEGLKAGDTLTAVVTVKYTTDNNGGALHTGATIKCESPFGSGKFVDCDTNGNPIIAPAACETNLSLPVTFDENKTGAWGVADQLIGQPAGSCRCQKGHCFGTVKLTLLDSNGNKITGKQTAMTISFNESGKMQVQ
jgi:hypothetical protein